MARPTTTAAQEGPPPEEPCPGESSSEEKNAVGRRRFLTYLVAAPTLTVAARWGLDEIASAEANAQLPPAPSPPRAPEFFDLGDALILAAAPTSHLLVLEVTEDNRIVLQLPRAEVGQGITTTVAMIVAEEMDARLADVEVPLSDARPELLFNQLTGASNSVRSLYDPVRNVAALARARMVGVAAQQWNVPADRLATRNGTVVAPNGRTASYGSLSAAAARADLPGLTPTPKDPSQYRLVGRPQTRIDARDIVTGRAKYALDLNVPGAMPTVVARPPQIRGTVRSFDESALRAMPGVLEVAQIPTGIAIMAETFGQAEDAQQAIQATWNPGTIDGLSDADIRDQLRAATLPLTVPPLATEHVDGEFDFAFVSHAPLEVLSAVADVRPDGAEVWSALKAPIIAQQTIADAISLPVNQVTVHVTRGGGSFGRRLFFDAALEAAQISKAMGRPVKLMWTRNDDMRHGRMRPASYHKIRFSYALGQVQSYEQQFTSVYTDFGHGLGEALTAAGVKVGHEGAAAAEFALTTKVPYNFGVVTEPLVNEIPLQMNTGSWRVVYSGTFRTAEEIMVDELARRLGRDPVEFRRQTLKTDRARAVLDKAANEGNWGRVMLAGHAQGVALHEEHRSVVACLVEMDANDPANPRVTKAVMAFDAGRPINPSGLQAQMLGGLTDGISTVLQAGLHIDNGAVREQSYADFRYARQAHSPRQVELHIMPATVDDELGGAGETSVPAAAGAVANAYARATGTSPRSFPINF